MGEWVFNLQKDMNNAFKCAVLQKNCHMNALYEEQSGSTDSLKK